MKIARCNPRCRPAGCACRERPLDTEPASRRAAGAACARPRTWRPGRWTPQTAGTYYIYFSCTPYVQSDKVNMMAQIRKNGAGSGSDYGTGFVNNDIVYDGDEHLVLHAQGIFSLNGSSDYVSPWVYLHNYTDQSTQRRTDLNYFGGFRIGAAF